MILRGTVRILSFMKHDIKVFSAIYGDNWQSLNILTTGETFAQNIIVYLICDIKVFIRILRAFFYYRGALLGEKLG